MIFLGLLDLLDSYLSAASSNCSSKQKRRVLQEALEIFGKPEKLRQKMSNCPVITDRKYAQCMTCTTSCRGRLSSKLPLFELRSHQCGIRHQKLLASIMQELNSEQHGKTSILDIPGIMTKALFKFSGRTLSFRVLYERKTTVKFS